MRNKNIKTGSTTFLKNKNYFNLLEKINGVVFHVYVFLGILKEEESR